MMKLILSSLFAVLSIVSADTINSTAKNPSMAVLGTQRSSATTIQPWIFPVAVSGAACNSTTDTVAVTSDHSSQLICQSGAWVAVGGGTDIASKTSNGYTKLPSGLIIQWGSAVINSQSQAWVGLSAAFPHACLNGIATGTGASDTGVAVGGCSQTAIYLINRAPAWVYNSVPTQWIFWMAIGY